MRGKEHNYFITDAALVGFVLILVLWECTFTAFDSLAVVLPGFGSVTLADVALVALAANYIYSVLYTARWRDWLGIDRRALAFMGWILSAALINCLMGTFTLTLFLRYTIRLALLWMLFSQIRRLGLIEGRFMVIGVLVISLLVCLIHIYIVLAHRTDLMESLYYAFSRSQHRADYDRMALGLKAEFNSNWPGGGLLISSLAVGALCGVLAARNQRVIWLCSACLLVASVALIVSLSRSRIMVVWLVIPLLLALRSRPQARLFYRLALLAVIGIVGVTGVFLFSPSLQSSVMEKIDRLSDTSDASYAMRLSDAQAAVGECIQRPFLGKGLPELGDADSVFGGDVHGALALVLMAGIPALCLLMAFCVAVWRIGCRRSDTLGFALQYIFIHMLLLFAINVEPLVVVTRSLIPFVIVASLLSQRPVIS